MSEVSKKELMKLSHKDNVRFALFCAYQVKEKWQDIPEKCKCIELVELWLENKVSRQECRTYANTYSAMTFPIYDVASVTMCALYTAANDPSAAYANAYSTAYVISYNLNNKELIKEQREYYNELLYIDDIFEKLVLESDIVV